MQQATDQSADPRLIVMLVYPGVTTMDLFGPLEPGRRPRVHALSTRAGMSVRNFHRAFVRPRADPASRHTPAAGDSACPTVSCHAPRDDPTDAAGAECANARASVRIGSEIIL